MEEKVMQEKYVAAMGCVFIAGFFLLVVAAGYFQAERDIAAKNYLSGLTPAERQHMVDYEEQQQAKQEQVNAENSKRLSDFLNTPIPLQWVVFLFLGIHILIWVAKMFSRW
jgi:hypothetical protein